MEKSKRAFSLYLVFGSHVSATTLNSYQIPNCDKDLGGNCISSANFESVPRSLVQRTSQRRRTLDTDFIGLLRAYCPPSLVRGLCPGKMSQQYSAVLEGSSHHSGLQVEEDGSSSYTAPAPHQPAAEQWFLVQFWHILMRCYSVVSFGWVLPLLKVGYSRRLEPVDLYALEEEDTSREVYARFKLEWRKSSSLVLSLVRAFGLPFAAAGCLKLIHDCLLFVGPQVLNKLIGF